VGAADAALLFLDVQIARARSRDELQALVPYLSAPDVHLGIDPEFAMTKGGEPGRPRGHLRRAPHQPRHRGARQTS
jgi:hypothetical protein